MRNTNNNNVEGNNNKNQKQSAEYIQAKKTVDYLISSIAGDFD